MKFTRRTFLKGTAATAGGLAAVHFLYGRMDTLRKAGAEAPLKEEWVPTACWIGKQDCGMLARKINGRVVKLEGHPTNPRNKGTLCPKGMAQIFAMYDPNRIQYPLIRTNKKGEHGKFRKATWDEALELTAKHVKEAREKAEKVLGKGKSKKDNPFLIWQKGRSKAKAFYDSAFTKALGPVKLHHGAYCSDAGYRAAEYVSGCHGVLNPDFSHCKYVLSWGWNITNAGGNKLCWITWPQEMLNAKEKGLKIVHIDPRLRSAGPFADKWLPIKPGTDLALAMTLCHELIRTKQVDWEYLKMHTNSPFLVGENGYFLSQNQKEMVYDLKSKSVKPHDATGIDPALEGEFTVDGKKYHPSFEVFKDHIKGYTPEWASKVCGIDKTLIETVAMELAENAHIGSTIRVPGKNGPISLPYRPVGIMAYHVAQQEFGFQAIRAMMMITMLLGSMGAVGGQMVDFHWKAGNFNDFEKIKISEETNIYLKNSKFYPINSNCTGVASRVVQSPEKYGVKHLPEVAIIHMCNPLVAFPSQKDIKAFLEKLNFVAVIDPWLSETADFYADVVLPASTLEKYEGPLDVGDPNMDAVSMRVPVMNPVYDTKGETEIYMDLCEKLGLLYEKDGYLDHLNKELKLKKELLSLKKKPTVREILDKWSKDNNIPGGMEYFEKYGVYSKGTIPAEKKYGYALNPVFGGVKHRLYGDSLLRIQEQMKEMKSDLIYYQDYTALPTWREPTVEKSPSDFDLYLISYKSIEFKQSRSSFIPLLLELAPKQLVYINPKTARAKGLKKGDFIWIESHNAITKETRKVKVEICFSEGIRPDVVAMPHHYGMWAHPWTKGQGPSPNELFYTGEGYVANTADQTFLVKVKIYKA